MAGNIEKKIFFENPPTQNHNFLIPFNVYSQWNLEILNQQTIGIYSNIFSIS